MGFFEASGKNGINVNETFFYVAKCIKEKLIRAQTSNGIQKPISNNNMILESSNRGSVL